MISERRFESSQKSGEVYFSTRLRVIKQIAYVACQRGCMGGWEIDDDRGGGVEGRLGTVSEVSVGGRLLRNEEYP